MSTKPRVAYFCMEYGLSGKLPIYSGGLGVLAGDVIKAAGDASAPLLGIGILWDRGYTRQTIEPTGAIVDAYPLTPRDALEPTGAEFFVDVEGTRVDCTAYRVNRYTCGGELFLIDPVNPKHRKFTRSLYGGGARDRVAQEIVLGIGGVRLLAALGREVDVYHFNEGHAVFAGFELLRKEMAKGVSFHSALKAVRSKVVFTTHTPVPAGNEVHPIAVLTKMGAFAGVGKDNAVAIGGAPFSMTVAGLRMARAANAVAELHGETARAMWADVDGAAPIEAITNGVHRGTWKDRRIEESSTSAQLAAAHQACKLELLAAIEARTGKRLSADNLTIGFARRAASYKRADLVLSDAVKLEALLKSGVQLVFSGKAHPADAAGKAVIKTVLAAAAKYPNIVFLQDYDMELGALLTRGADVWLNNPRRPKEACGTSGMKAAMNGVLNVSILDGWWPEGCVDGRNGWRIEASVSSTASADKRDVADRDELFRVLRESVVPAFRNRDRWLDMMAASIAMATERFSAARMVADYYAKLYTIPSA